MAYNFLDIDMNFYRNLFTSAISLLVGPLVVSIASIADISAYKTAVEFLESQLFPEIAIIGLAEFSWLALVLLLLFGIHDYDLYKMYHRQGYVHAFITFCVIVVSSSIMTFYLGLESFSNSDTSFYLLLLSAIANNLIQSAMIAILAVEIAKIVRWERSQRTATIKP